ncbi:MAG: ABC transporter transmembrane domain-containing protein [Myxococcota bacterium]
MKVTSLELPKTPAVRMFRRVLALTRRELQGIAALLVYAVAVGILSLAVPLTVQAVIQNVAAGGLRQPLIVLSALLLLGLGLSAAFTLAQLFLVELAARRIFVHTAERFVDQLVGAQLGSLRGRGEGFVHRFYDVITIEKSFTALILEGLATLLQVGVGAVLLAVYHPALLAFDVVLLLLALSPLPLGRSAAESAVKESSAKFAVGAWLDEVSTHGIWARVDGESQLVESRTRAALDRWLEARRVHFRYVAWQTGLLVGTQAIATAGLLGIGGWLVIEGELTLGQLVAAELVMTATVSSLARIGKLLPKYYDLGAALEKVAVVDELPSEPQGGRGVPAAAPWRLQLDEVQTEAGGRKTSFTVDKGGLVVVPASAAPEGLGAVLIGSDPTLSGRVQVDDIELRDLDKRLVRARVAVVRDAEIFAGTIEENVALGRPEATLEEIQDALTQVGLLDDIRQLKAGLGTDARELDRPQALALTFARALLRHPSLLLVDRALDALDGPLHARLAEAIARCTATRIVVTSALDIFQLTGPIAVARDEVKS